MTKAERELAVFVVFAGAMGIGGKPESRPEPQPDILLTPPAGLPRSFELVEIIDQGYAHMTGLQLATKRACDQHMNRLPADELAAFRERFGNALLHFEFPPAMTMNRRIGQLPEAFKSLLGQPAGWTGNLETANFEVRVSRGRFTGPILDVGGAVWVGDPTAERLNSKMRKSYNYSGTLNLLAYIDGGPMFPNDVWLPDLDEYLGKLDSTCQFSVVYVFDCGTGTCHRTWTRPASSNSGADGSPSAI